VKNAFKTLSYYRMSDMAIILAMWMMHHLTNGNILFSQLPHASINGMHTNNHGMVNFIAVMLVLAAMIKSAQFPFTTWLPRAMEGPTSSSAIFYGSLSVHIGVFLLLRTYPFWQGMLWVKVLIISIGALTAIVATLIGRVQPTVKTQIAYSSAAQIGIIFMEVALGLHWLALVHFAGNAFLRTYQLLVSPSVLNYLVHHQYFHYHPPQSQKVSKLGATLYMLGIKEWNLDGFMRKLLWAPFKWLGNQVQVFKSVLVTIAWLLTGIGAMAVALYKPLLLQSYAGPLSITFLAIALSFILFSFSHRGSAFTAWVYLLLAHLFIVAGITIQTLHINTIEFIFYATGIIAAFLLGWYCLQKINRINNDILLDKYHGYVYEQKTTALLFLIAAVGLIGFPITAAFIGIDVFFTYVHSNDIILITLLALCFIFIELAAIRIFLRIFYGLHHKLDHPVAFRSS
ncbi:MAG: hypothetical protein H7X88_06560, partial [Gloeobacteraceae cyanobacterium ES-bin-316]|nr:hypothetical protein [Ferruginibacter sp.]